jgi:hypothetical protein
MTAPECASRFAIYSRLRWLGIATFCLGLGLLACSIAAVMGGAPLKLLPFSIATMGLSLGSFGAANDTAVHALREWGRQAPLSGAASAELRTEGERRAERLAKVHASPKAAFILPLVVVALIAGWFHIYTSTGSPA